MILFDKRRKAQQVGRAALEMLLHGFKIAAQDIGPGALAYRAGLQIQQQLQLPLRENMPLDSTTDQFLNELIERC